MNLNKLVEKQFINRAKMLARVMTSTANIQVTVSGSDAYMQPGRINIPAGDFSDPEWVAMVHGWIDHELGHEDETDFRVTKIAHESRLLNDFYQIFEDVRMEKSRGEKFKGARINLERLVELAVKREIFQRPEDDCHPIIAVQYLCLYYGRSHIIQQHSLSDYADIAKQLVAEKLGDNLMNDICDVIHKVEFAKDTAESLLLAREVMLLIKQELDKQKQQPDEPEDEPDTDPQDGDDEDDSDTDPQAGDDEDNSDTDPQAGDDEDNSDSDPQAGDDEDDSDTDPQAGDDEDNSDSDPQAGDGKTDSGQPQNNRRPAPKKPSAQDIIQALEQALNDEVEGLEDFHDALAQLLGEEAEEAQEEQPELNALPNCEMVNTKQIRLNGALDEITAKRLSGGVYQTMHKVLFDQVRNLESARKTGTRILNSKIAGIPAGNLNVFKRHVEQQDISAAISVIVDGSGSMGYYVEDTDITRMQFANTCALAFAAGLDKTGVAVEVSYYGLSNGHHANAYIAKPFDAKTKAQNFKVLPDDSTPTGEMMMHALNSLALRPENKKLMFVLTDGAPNDDSIVVKATQIANSLGIKVVPIGICTKVVRGFNEGDFVTVDDPSQLTSALREAVKLKLFN